MKALTLTQPWATLVELGEKRIETRSWDTRYRGPLAIHAAKSVPAYANEAALYDELFVETLAKHGLTFSDLPRGVVIAVAQLTGTDWTHQTSRIVRGNPGQYPPHELMFGNYDRGRFAWLITDVQALPEPIAAKGSLGLWEWDEAGLEP